MWRTVNMYGMIVFCAVLGLLYWRRLGPWLTLTWVYFLARGLFIFQNLNTDFPEIARQLDQSSGQAFSQLLLIPLIVLLLPQRIFKHWQKFFTYSIIIDAVALFYFDYGFLNASSFDSGFIALTFPLFNLIQISLLCIPIFFAGHMATAITVSASLLIAIGIKKKEWRVFTAFAVPVLFTAFYFHPGTHHFNTSNRFEAWQRFITWWIDHASLTFGTGTGTFQWFGPYIDGFLTGRTQGEIFLQMHNDWLQVLFEGGIVGSLLVFLSWIDLTLRSFSRSKLFYMMIGLGVFCLTYHPLRFFPSALFIACLIREVLNSDNDNNRKSVKH